MDLASLWCRDNINVQAPQTVYERSASGSRLSCVLSASDGARVSAVSSSSLERISVEAFGAVQSVSSHHAALLKSVSPTVSVTCVTIASKGARVCAVFRGSASALPRSVCA